MVLCWPGNRNHFLEGDQILEDEEHSEHEDHVSIHSFNGRESEDGINHQTFPAPAHLQTIREASMMYKNSETGLHISGMIH